MTTSERAASKELQRCHPEAVWPMVISPDRRPLVVWDGRKTDRQHCADILLNLSAAAPFYARGLQSGGATAMWKSIVLAAVLVGSPLAMAQTTAPDGTSPGSATSQLSDVTIQKAGHALRDVAQIKMDYSQRLQTVQDPGQRQQLVQEAQGRQIQAVEAHGLSVQQYDQVMNIAQADPQVKQRLLAAAGAQ